MPQIDISGSDSKLSCDKLQGQSGTTVNVLTGHTLAIADAGGLTVNGSAVPTSGGGLTFISSVTASASATVDFLSSFSATYDVYIVRYCDVVPATDGVFLGLRVAQGGTAQSTGQYRQATTQRRTDADSAGNGETASTEFDIHLNAAGNTSGEHSSGEAIFYNPLSTSSYKSVAWRNGMNGIYGATRNIYVHNIGAGSYWSTTATSGFQFRFSSGNITSGTFRLYGIVNS